MVKETKTGRASAAVDGAAAVGGGSGGFKAAMKNFVYSGDTKHVFAGLLIIAAISAVPWYYMTKGKKQLSHQDYMDKADRARDDRLSGGSKLQKKLL